MCYKSFDRSEMFWYGDGEVPDSDLKIEEEKPKDDKPHDNEGDRMKDFFFPDSRKGQVVKVCECGKDRVGDAGKHSRWCPKYMWED